MGNERPSKSFFQNIVSKLDAAISSGRAEIVSGPTTAPRETTLDYTPSSTGRVNMADLAKGADAPGSAIPDHGFPPNPVLGTSKR